MSNERKGGRRQRTRLARTLFIAAACTMGMAVSVLPAVAADWPTYRADSARSGITTEAVQPPLTLQWTCKPMHGPKPAWPKPAEERHRMEFDRAYFATMAGGLVYFGTSADDKMMALDAATGQTRWTFLTQGPVRFAPSVWNRRVYFGSDDGYVYCLTSDEGKLIWKYRPGPSDEKVVGNGRMISRWPIRTSVLVDDRTVYFGAGVFPSEGLYIGALKAEDGSVIWKNDSLDERAHELTYGGVTPQGYLIASANNLYVPAGRAMPVAFDRKTGKSLYVCDAGGKTGGAWALVSGGELIAGVDNSGTPAKVAYKEGTGAPDRDAFAWFPGIDMVVAPEMTYMLTERGVYAIDRKAYLEMRATTESQGKTMRSLSAAIQANRRAFAKATPEQRRDLERKTADATRKLAEIEAEANRLREKVYAWRYVGRDLRSLILAGSVVYVGGAGVVTGLDARTGAVLWNGDVDGHAEGLAAAAGRLCVSTERGTVHCFGGQAGQPAKVGDPAKAGEVRTRRSSSPRGTVASTHEAAAARIVRQAGTDKGWCLILNCGEGHLAQELAKQSQFKIVALESDPARLTSSRDRLEGAGLLGVRVAVEPWKIADLPDYFANVIVSDDAASVENLSASVPDLLRILRPFGGVICLGASAERAGEPKEADLQKLAEALTAAGLTGAKVTKDGGLWVTAVRGKLEGAGAWTQLYAGPHNTACSDDLLDAAPFSVLWFGEPGPEGMVERHARPTSPVAANGRMYVQGEEAVTGVDAYNGTVLWKREIPGAVRVRADVDGGNLALCGDVLYVAAEDKCYRLDGQTGRIIRVYDLPASPDGEPRRWGYVSAAGKVLLGSAAFPLGNEYAAVWKAIVTGDRWKDLAEVPPQYAPDLQRLKAKYPVPDALARAELQRSGELWRSADFPVWGSEQTPRGSVTTRMMVSDSVFAIDPESAKPLWVHRGKGIPQISITVGDGTVYLVENGVTPEQKAAAISEKDSLTRKGLYEVGDEAKLGKGIEDVRLVVALDLATGQRLWARALDLTGCGGDKMGTAYQDGMLVFLGHFSNHDKAFFASNELRWRRITTVDAKTGEMAWSRPLNYLRRPLIVGDTIIIEPRACDLRTGRIKMRAHPISGEPVPWEFYRPGHCCSITSASPNCMYYRSYCGAIYDLKRDAGLTLFGAIRPGCWLNMIAANGLLMMPEYSSGCTCSFPLRCSVAMKPSARQADAEWTVFITHGPETPVRHLAVNFGAPGDRPDESGTMWFAWPRPQARDQRGTTYGVTFGVGQEILPGMGYFGRDVQGNAIGNTDRPWLFTSGCVGLIKCELPLIDDIWSDRPGVYTVRLGFAAPEADAPGQRVFDIKLQGRTVAEGIDIVKAAGGPNKVAMKEFKSVPVANRLKIELVPKASGPSPTQAPLINCVEAIREDGTQLAQQSTQPKPLPETEAKALLGSAKARLDEKKIEEAIGLYHTLLDVATSVDLKAAALEGMAAIGSPKSLSRIALYCRETSPILHNYQEVPKELRTAGTKALVAIAANLAATDRDRSIRMLRYAKTLAADASVRQQALDALNRMGVKDN
jgi:outer membrane protein assembly factor BamB